MTQPNFSNLIPFFDKVSDINRQLLANNIVVTDIPKSKQIIARGDEVGGVYIVSRGALRVYYQNPEGREGTLYWIEKSQSCILALNCTFTGLEYPAWVETEEETQIIMIPSATFKSVFKNESIVQFYVFEALSGRLFEMMQLLEETASFGLEARIAALLLRKSQGQGFIEITQDQIAGHLCTSREVVSRTIRRLAKAGMIANQIGIIKILNSNGLQTLLK